jgi:hypothetical protein
MAGPETGIGRDSCAEHLNGLYNLFLYRDSSKKVPKNGEHRSNAGPSARARTFVFSFFWFSLVLEFESFSISKRGFTAGFVCDFRRYPTTSRLFDTSFLFIIYET